MIDLMDVLERHSLWLESAGKEGERADLREANLRGADLSGANLRWANLRGANLRGATLWDAAGDNRHIKSLQCGTYAVAYTAEALQIGCKQFPIEDWWGFDDKKILRMDGKGGLMWWKNWKPILQKIIEVSPAEPTGWRGED